MRKIKAICGSYKNEHDLSHESRHIGTFRDIFKQFSGLFLYNLILNRNTIIIYIVR